jgi:uncharacterized protein (DUF433 family)
MQNQEIEPQAVAIAGPAIPLFGKPKAPSVFPSRSGASLRLCAVRYSKIVLGFLCSIFPIRQSANFVAARGFGFGYNFSMNENPVTINPKVMHGTPCFAGTRVPVRSLFDHLEGGYNVEYFLEEFPTVGREQVAAVLEQAKSRAEADAVVVNGSDE